MLPYILTSIVAGAAVPYVLRKWCDSKVQKARNTSLLSSVENLFKGLETVERNQVLHGILELEQQLPIEVFKEKFRKLAERHLRFRQKVIKVPMIPFVHAFQDDPDFELEHHLKYASVASPNDDEAFKRKMEEVMFLPLVPNRPLWEAWLIDGHKGGCAIYFKVHHSVTDGISSNLLVISLTENQDGTPYIPLLTSSSSMNLTPKRKTLYTQAVRLLVAFLRVLLLPFFALVMITKLHLELLCSAPTFKSILRGPYAKDSNSKIVGWSECISLHDIKRVKNVFKVTVNDVVTAVVVGALRQYALSSCPNLTERSLQENIFFSIPISLRKSLDVSDDLSNSISGLWLKLPLKEHCEIKRLHTISQRMTHNKTYPIYAWTNLLCMVGLGYTPAAVVKQTFDPFLSKAVGIMTNVPGPQRKLYIGGVPVRLCLGLGLQPTQGGLSFTIISYDDKVSMTVLADRQENSESPMNELPSKLSELFQAEFDKLMKAADKKEAEMYNQHEPQVQQISG
eukprot:GILK01011665.1.p1 GENE.GILK01011665.1~~GILK01011665.1.p1  ORF type:complete len:510 (-),score=85.64 GILK01011665.1:307-1836(-)